MGDARLTQHFQGLSDVLVALIAVDATVNKLAAGHLGDLSTDDAQAVHFDRAFPVLSEIIPVRR